MLALILFSAVVFNFRNIFGIGVYDIKHDYANTYSDGTAGINLHIHFNHLIEYRYSIYMTVEKISTGNVVNHGFLSVFIVIYKQSENAYSTSIQSDTPINEFSVNKFYLSLKKYYNVTCCGTIMQSLETGGLPINDTINFKLTFIIPLSMREYYNIDLAIYTLFFFQFFLYVIVPVVLVWIFKPLLGYHYNEEEMKRDEQYLKYLHDFIKEQRKKTKI